MESRGGLGVTAQLPRTTPHISSTKHRLVRQGHQTKEVTLTAADQHPPSVSSSSTLSNFREASSSRSVTPHPFIGSSLKRSSHNPPVTSGHGIQMVQMPSETGTSVREDHLRYHSSASTGSASSSHLMTGKHHPQSSVGHRSGLTGKSAKMGPHPKETYQNGGEGRGGRGGGHTSGIPSPLKPVSSRSNPSAATSFFTRAAQKVSSASKTKKHRTVSKEKTVAAFPTNFSAVILKSPPPVPRLLLRPIGRTQNTLLGKVRVMLRVCPVEGAHGSFLSIDQHRNQVTAYDPSNYGHSSSSYRRHLPPKMFGFDAVFSPSDTLAEICAVSLVDILQAVVGGADGCLFCYGHARIGKTYTMVGDESPLRLGVIPCAISWLFQLINEQKEQTGARFSVRVSAVEVTGKQEVIKDLLAGIMPTAEASATSPGMYLREDPVCGTQLENQSELRAPTAERAAYFLDAAIAARTVPDADEDARNSHLLFTIHVYQYRVESTSEGRNGVVGGRSRLHLIDFGSCSRTREGSALSLSALGTVIMSLLNGQRHVPYRESTLTQLVKEALGSLSCHACMIVHVSPAIQAYNESLQVMQLATRLQRIRTKRRSKFSSTSSEDSSCDENKRIRSRMRLGVRMGTLCEGSVCSTDCTSSSEQSCDTVIFVGDNSCSPSERDFTDCEGTKIAAIPVPRFTPPSGLVKISGLSRVDEVIEARHSSGEIMYSTPPYAPSASFSSLIPHSKTAGFKSRLNKIGRNFTEKQYDNEFCKTRDICASHSHGEQWVDGPGSTYKGSPVSRDSEQWVDGPPEFQKDTRSEESTAIPSASKGGLSSAETKSTALSTSSAASSCVSRLPYKAARTAKIAMLYRRDSSPCEIEQENSQSKTFSDQVDQEENVLDELQSRSNSVISKECYSNCHNVIEPLACNASNSETFGTVDEISDLHPSCDSSDEDSEFCNVNLLSKGCIYEKECNVDIRVKNDEVMIDADETKSNVETKSEVINYESAKNCILPVEKNSLIENASVDLLDREDKSQAMGVDDSQKFVYHTSVNTAEKISDIAFENRTNCWDVEDGSGKSHAVKLNVGSLLLHNRESIYELQLDQELERGSRESLQRLIYGSDDDSSAWHSEAPSVNMDENCKWLEEMSLDALNDSVKQISNQQNVKTEKEIFANFASVSSPCDGCNKTTFSEADILATPFETSETAATNNLHVTDTSVSLVVNKAKAFPDSTLNFSDKNEYLMKDIISPVAAKEELIPRSASTPIKSSNLRLPSRTLSSKIPESLQKSDQYKMSPQVSQTSLVKNKSCVAASQTICVSSVQETSSKIQSSKLQSSKLQSRKMQSMPSLSKDSSPNHVKSEVKANSGFKKLGNFGLRSGHNLTANPSVSESNRKTSKSAMCLTASLLTLKSSSTSIQDPKQSHLTVTKRNKLSPKTGHELICTRVEAPPIVISTANDGRLLSPYHMVTKPRVLVHSSSGQGSDCSSVAENVTIKATSRTSEVEASSGYESMIRDSEFTGTSSSQDSNCESTSTGKGKGIKIFRKRAKGRSRSAPARWFSSEGTVRLSRRMFPLLRPTATYYCAESLPEEPLEIKTFSSEDVERMSRWRKKEAELQSLQDRRCRIQELLDIQATLKRNLARSKEILMVDPESWSYDLHIADNLNRDDPSYLQGLEKETAILEKRIQACKSRIMMVTCFDVTA